ncbi:MAG: hypothetical protein HGGPFJEG_00800 [Ignavibacteria bacterium]|nr:hypothetical protein [Ignavibacteria bacterium]
MKLYESIQNIIKFADTKINVLSVINGIATSYILTNFQLIYSINIYSKLLLALYFIMFIVFIYYLLNTILPRIKSISGNKISRAVYFGHISERKEVQEFVNDFKKLNDEEFLEDLLTQIYESSKIATTKFSYYKKSLITLQVQFSLFFILLALKSFT